MAANQNLVEQITLSVESTKDVQFSADEAQIINAVSPKVNIRRMEDGAVITVTDVDGVHDPVTIYDGAKGEKGDAGGVQYDSAQSLNATQKQTARTNISAASEEDVTGLKSAISPYIGTPIIMEQGKYVPIGTGATAGVNSKVTDSAYRCAVIDCTQIQNFIVNGFGGNSPRLWAFTDASYKIMARAEANTTGENLCLFTPAGASYFIINTNTTDESYSNATFYPDSTAPKNYKVITFTANGYIAIGNNAKATPSTPVTDFAYSYAIEACKIGDMFIVNGASGRSPRLWAFIDSENNILSRADESITGTNLEIVAPDNAAYIILNNSNLTARSYKLNYYNAGKEELNEILKSKICVSDSLHFTCASAPETVVDEAKGIVYCTYLASRQNYGEQRDIVALSVIPIANPQQAQHYIVAENGVSIGSVEITDPFEPNIMKIGDNIIILFKNDDKYYARFFDTTTNEFGNFIDCSLIYNSTAVHITDSNVITAITSYGGTADGWCILTGKIVKHGTVYYSTLTCSTGNPLVIRSTNGYTWDVMGMLPTSAYYEAQLAFIGERMVVILRSTTNPNVYYSDDYGATFTSVGYTPVQNTRPQIISYGNKLVYSIPNTYDETPYFAPQGRMGVNIVVADDSSNPAGIEPYVVINSHYGVVYPSLFVLNSIVYAIFSTGEFFSEKVASRGAMGKDALFMVRIGKILSNYNFIQ